MAVEVIDPYSSFHFLEASTDIFARAVSVPIMNSSEVEVFNFPTDTHTDVALYYYPPRESPVLLFRGSSVSVSTDTTFGHKVSFFTQGHTFRRRRCAPIVVVSSAITKGF